MEIINAKLLKDRQDLEQSNWRGLKALAKELFPDIILIFSLLFKAFLKVCSEFQQRYLFPCGFQQSKLLG